MISAKTEYACRALLDLSLRWPDVVPRQIAEIARVQKIPKKFLTHILIALKALGYVESARGKNGGYYLTTAPQTIKLIDIISCFGGMAYADQDKTQSQDVMPVIWREIDTAVRKALDHITFETICNQQRCQGKAMMYDI